MEDISLVCVYSAIDCVSVRVHILCLHVFFLQCMCYVFVCILVSALYAFQVLGDSLAQPTMPLHSFRRQDYEVEDASRACLRICRPTLTRHALSSGWLIWLMCARVADRLHLTRLVVIHCHSTTVYRKQSSKESAIGENT